MITARITAGTSAMPKIKPMPTSRIISCQTHDVIRSQNAMASAISTIRWIIARTDPEHPVEDAAAWPKTAQS